MSGTLTGLRVIDAATNIAGPWAASILADLGAEVVKVEPLKGDPMRAYPPFVDDVQTQYAAVNHEKRYLALDLRSERGREVLHRCLADCDVLIQNLRPGHEAKLGLDPEACHAANPRLVHASIAAFHPVDGARPGYDLLVQGESGLMDQTGEPDMPPSRIGAAAIDYASGLWLAIGILAELRGDRDKAAVRVSMLDVASGLLNEKISAFLATGIAPQRLGSRTATTTPHGAFATGDGFIVIGAATDHAFARLAAVLGPPLEEERFTSQAGRLVHREELEAALAAALADKGTEHWLAVLDAAGVPVGRVADLASMTERHRKESRTGFRAIDGVEGLEVMAPAFSFGEREWGSLPRPGGIGEHSDEVLGDLGLTAAEIAALHEEGLVG